VGEKEELAMLAGLAYKNTSLIPFVSKLPFRRMVGGLLLVRGT